MLNLLTRRQDKAANAAGDYLKFVAKAGANGGTLDEADAAKFEALCADLGKADDDVTRDIKAHIHLNRLKQIASTAGKLRTAADKAKDAARQHELETERLKVEFEQTMKARAEAQKTKDREAEHAEDAAAGALLAKNGITAVRWARHAAFGLDEQPALTWEMSGGSTLNLTGGLTRDRALRGIADVLADVGAADVIGEPSIGEYGVMSREGYRPRGW